EVLVGDDDVAVRGVLVALDGVGPGDDLLVDRAPRLHLDPALVLVVEHVEPDLVARLGREIELDGDRHQPELDGPLPHRARHGMSSCVRLDRYYTVAGQRARMTAPARDVNRR